MLHALMPVAVSVDKKLNRGPASGLDPRLDVFASELGGPSARVSERIGHVLLRDLVDKILYNRVWVFLCPSHARKYSLKRRSGATRYDEAYSVRGVGRRASRVVCK